MRDITEAAAPTRFIGLLSAAGPLPTAAAARALGFEPDGSFCVVAVAGGDVAVPVTAGRTVSAALDGVTLVVLQGVGSDEAAAVLAADDPARIAGISAVRPGLDGARLAVKDARQALALAQGRGSTVMWESCWWLAVLTEHVEQLRGVVTPTWTFASANAHLAEAVEAYADESFSSTRAARRLFVHPNTVLYRLRQWHRNTGLNPSGISGLAASVASVELGRLVHKAESGTPPTTS